MKGKLSPLGIVLANSIKNLGLDLQFTQQKVIDQWSEIVGKQISSISKPYNFKFRTLFVYVVESMWLHQLVFLEDEVKKKINEYIGKKLVQKIYFKIGEFSVDVEDNNYSEKTKDNSLDFLNFTDMVDEKEAESTVSNLKNAELKSILKRIIMKERGVNNFRRQNKLNSI